MSTLPQMTCGELVDRRGVSLGLLGLLVRLPVVLALAVALAS